MAVQVTVSYSSTEFDDRWRMKGDSLPSISLNRPLEFARTCNASNCTSSPSIPTIQGMEPIATLTAAVIAKLAFDEFVKSGAGELAKQSIGGTVELAKRLRDKIQARFKGNDRAEIALLEVEKQGTPTMLEKVARYLDIEMMEDEAFATEIRQMAQEIINIQNQNISEHKYINYGRDQFNIGAIHGDANIGGS